ncbi:hypothetical protein H2203_007556 [Taxawa tesnikishii (nom. ined.)]|nr:hypothetical protein H2203_007556 [Dothideales sp. JES 119]
MSEASNPSPASSDISMSSALSPTAPQHQQHRQAPTALHPAPFNMRTSFKDFHTFATVIVGTPGCKSAPQTEFRLHKEVLTRASPFFAAALNGAFAEGMDQTVKLPEEKPDIFEWFVQWLYSGTLTTPAAGTNCTSSPATPSPNPLALLHTPTGAPIHPYCHHHHHPNNPLTCNTTAATHHDGDLRNAAGSPKYFLLLDLYALSDRLLTTRLSNHILDTLARLSEATNSVPTPSDTWILYDSIRDSAPVRRLVLDLFAYKKTDKLLESHRDEWHPRFLRELVVKLKRPGPESLDRHALTAWRPGSWPAARACEGCRELVKPGVQGRDIMSMRAREGD